MASADARFGEHGDASAKKMFEDAD